MIVKYPKINNDNLFQKIEHICKNENIPYTIEGINTLLFVSSNDIRQSINNLECIYYSLGSLSEENVYQIIDKPKPYYITKILKDCYNKEFNSVMITIKDIYYKGYTANDILLTFIKYILENNEINNIVTNEETKLKIYEIISLCYIRVNAGVDTLLQLCGCISKIYMFVNS